jgi:hypothetical protein
MFSLGILLGLYYRFVWVELPALGVGYRNVTIVKDLKDCHINFMFQIAKNRIYILYYYDNVLKDLHVHQ